tara:strand:+ start:428 stop:628 length:201 start_codon:yes stop_codon:yes gene_type:complete
MKDILAKVTYGPNKIEIIEDGNHVLCAISKRKIFLDTLTYWNVDLQEAYFSPEEVHIRQKELKKKL